LRWGSARRQRKHAKRKHDECGPSPCLKDTGLVASAFRARADTAEGAAATAARAARARAVTRIVAGSCCVLVREVVASG
jgi:hypothetical protein